MSRTYVPSMKHKWPKGFGSLCPTKMPDDVPPGFLQRAISVEGVGANKLWFATGNWCFCAHPSPGKDAWHGFPVIGGDVDERVWQALLERKLVTEREVRRFRKQRTLPAEWP